MKTHVELGPIIGECDGCRVPVRLVKSMDGAMMALVEHKDTCRDGTVLLSWKPNGDTITLPMPKEAQ